jgi:hypothetical protein
MTRPEQHVAVDGEQKIDRAASRPVLNRWAAVSLLFTVLSVALPLWGAVFPGDTSNHALAVSSSVLALGVVATPFALLALLTGLGARKLMRDPSKSQGGRWMATAGITIGLAWLPLLALSLLVTLDTWQQGQ